MGERSTSSDPTGFAHRYDDSRHANRSPDHDNFTAGASVSHSEQGEPSMAMQSRTEASALGISEAPLDGAVHRHGAAPGFRHFLGNPNASQRFKVYGIDPLNAPEHLPKIRELMNRLS